MSVAHVVHVQLATDRGNVIFFKLEAVVVASAFDYM